MGFQLTYKIMVTRSQEPDEFVGKTSALTLKNQQVLSFFSLPTKSQE